MNFLAVDGNSIANRAFYGIRALNAPDGTPTNAVYGFIAILRRLMEEEKPDGILVAFDVHAPTFRHEKYDAYKGTRKGMPEELQIQMPIIKEVLDAWGIARYEQAGIEADDILGSFSKLCENAGHSCTLATGDRDSFQLIDEDTRVLFIKSSGGKSETINYTLKRFTEEYGFMPENIVDLKALMGDSSDNIPGVPGIGEKTGTELIKRFSTLISVFENIDSPEIKESVRKKLIAGRDSAFLSFELATINRDCTINIAPESALMQKGENPAGLYSVFKRLGFQKLIAQMGLSAPLQNEDKASKSDGICEDELCFDAVKIQDNIAAKKAHDALISSDCAPFYYCLGGFDEIYAAAENNGITTVFCYEADSFTGDRKAAIKALFPENREKTGHNIKNIIKSLMILDIPEGEWVFDTALAAWLIDSSVSDPDIKFIAQKYCSLIPPDEGDGSSGQISLFDGPRLPDKRLCFNAACGKRLVSALKQKLSEQELDKLYYTAELPLCRVLADMEKTGIKVDSGAIKDFGESMTETIEALKLKIWALAGEEFNINSPKQLGVILFEKLMLPFGKKTKTGWSTNADVLEKLAEKHEIIPAILEYRTLAKLKSTYCDGLIKALGADGRIHTEFQMTATATGRLSSTEPNLQNIPVRKSFGGKLRGMFVAEEGKLLVDADYSQIELRLLAHVSGDRGLISAFCEGKDIHRQTASQVFSLPPEEITKEQRSKAKAVNFGIIYGIGAWSLGRDIDVSAAEAKLYMERYLSEYIGVKEYQEQTVKKANAEGYVQTAMGRRRYFPELKSPNRNLRAFAERAAMNMPIQGFAADLMKLATVNVWERLRKELPDAKLLLQVHDELIAEVSEENAEKAAEIIKEEMESALTLSVPVLAEAKAGKSWADAH